MLTDLVKYIVGLGKESVERKVLDFPNDPQKKLVVSKEGHEVLETPYAAKNENCSFISLSSFVTYLAQLDEVESKYIFLELTDTGLLATYNVDSKTFRWEVLLPFQFTQAFNALCKFTECQKLNHEQMIYLLRQTLKGFVPSGVLESYRSVNFQVRQEASRTMQQGLRSMDSSVIATVLEKEGGGKKPEEFLISMNPFEDLEGLMVGMVMNVEIDPRAQVFEVELASDAYEKARLAALEHARKVLQAAINTAFESDDDDTTTLTVMLGACNPA